MHTQAWQRVICILAASAALLGLPVLGLAGDVDSDGISDALETTGLTWEGFPYPPCASGTLTMFDRNRCVSSTSQDIFVYLVTAAGGGFLLQAGLITTDNPANVSMCTSTASTSCTGLFAFIAAPKTPINTRLGTVDGLGLGVHVKVVNAPPTNRTVGNTGQQAVVMTVDESASAFAFGKTPEGTPSNTGQSIIWPVYVKNFVTQNVTGGAVKDTVWKPYVQNTASHELSHASALTAAFNSRVGDFHYASGSGTVMDDKVLCSSKTQTCNVYNDYAKGDFPCLLALVSPTTNPLQCTAFTIVE